MKHQSQLANNINQLGAIWDWARITTPECSLPYAISVFEKDQRRHQANQLVDARKAGWEGEMDNPNGWRVLASALLAKLWQKRSRA